ncbi:MAG: hypothetical protein Q4F13_11755 [Pseudomonadota bacterium]|nr:hypothetical protein [Pseudomonadota bacterium]
MSAAALEMLKSKAGFKTPPQAAAAHARRKMCGWFFSSRRAADAVQKKRMQMAF